VHQPEPRSPWFFAGRDVGVESLHGGAGGRVRVWESGGAGGKRSMWSRERDRDGARFGRWAKMICVS
jgi:hypothetical protein